VWRDAGLDPPRLAINVSGRQLDEEGFVDDLVAALATAGRPRPRQELEITESLILNEKRISKSMLHRLAGAGIEWSLDDFGTGYSSLTYLTKFPIANLKIDRSFVNRIPGDANSEAIVRAVLGMAGGLGMEVVIEGIETSRQAKALVAMGGRVGQGYLFHRPLVREQVQALLQNGPQPRELVLDAPNPAV
jgi:EAL domain-containing protein (putative c-di-GMP-specific phosphodiesterase class I)